MLFQEALVNNEISMKMTKAEDRETIVGRSTCRQN
jgi:hypothetical protein